MMPADVVAVARVARLTRAGRSVQEISKALGLHRSTVYAHLTAARTAGIDLDPLPHASPRTAPVPPPEEGDWRQRGACRDEDPELFFPVGTTGPAAQKTEQAKAMCRRCPVSSTCLTWAIDTGQDAGVWGGTTEGERRALVRQRARARAGTS